LKTTTLLLLLFIAAALSAQTYPYAEGFEGMPNTQVPAGWGGSMKVLQNHGINDFKAICARVSSAVTVDSGITPLIGPLTAASALSFKFRFIDQANYPSTPTNLDAGDQLEVLLSTDSVNYQLIQLIDMNNYTATFNFVQKKIYLSQYAGSSVYFKFRAQYGTGTSFFVDIDTVRAADEPQTGISDITTEESFRVYPNPCSGSMVSCLAFIVDDALFGKEYTIVDLQGKVIERNRITTRNQKPETRNLSAGMYFVQAGNLTRKLIIQ
jgi:hypothetical protein